MTHALLFDMDGTLVHSDPIHAAVFIDLLAEYGIDMTAERYVAEFLGRRNDTIFAALLPNEDAEALDIEKERRFRTRLDEIPDLVPGARKLLERAKREHWKTALVTNACRENAQAVIDRFDLADLFDTVALGGDCARPKPAPDVYLAAMDRLAVAPADCIAYEDSPTGLAAARAAGVTVIGLASSLTEAELRAHGATATLRDFDDPALEPLLPLPIGPRP